MQSQANISLPHKHLRSFEPTPPNGRYALRVRRLRSAVASPCKAHLVRQNLGVLCTLAKFCFWAKLLIRLALVSFLYNPKPH